jgi:hypothetical protein
VQQFRADFAATGQGDPDDVKFVVMGSLRPVHVQTNKHVA